MRELLTAMASLMGVIAFCKALFSTIFPPELRFTAMNFFARLSNYFSAYCYFDVTETDGVSTNELYNAVQLYLSSGAAATANYRLSLTRAINASKVTFGLSSNDVVFDTFRGFPVQWEHTVIQRQSSSFSWRPLPEERRHFTLRLRKHHKEPILNPYLDHIMQRSEEIRRRNEDRYLFTNSKGGVMNSRGPQPWEAVPFKHPSTFETLAMDPVRKSEIMADLKDFATGQSFYQKTGRAWKRGYLLYGPPGTGKSSMIAAMANFLGYDIYDLELTEVSSNSELRKLLMKTTSKSLIVIEDIDCSISVSNRKQKDRNEGYGEDNHQFRDSGDGISVENIGGESGKSMTLSGLLNFTDGLWSCCGSERIFVFTTNHVDKLDPALLRSGRMDMHIHMGYCTFQALRILLSNYLGIGEEEVGEVAAAMRELEELTAAAKMTPADVSEVLLRSRREKVRAVRELVKDMRRRVGYEKVLLGTVEEVEEKRAVVEETAAKQMMCWSFHDFEEEDKGKKKKVNIL